MGIRTFSTLLCLALVSSPAAAQYLLRGPQGEPGDPEIACTGDGCSLNANLVIHGDVIAQETVVGYELSWSGALTVAGGYPLTVDRLTVAGSLDLPACPQGYSPATDQAGLEICQRSVGARTDEVVLAGDRWVDRYEVSLWATPCGGEQFFDAAGDFPASFPANGNWSARVYGCSAVGVVPAAFGSWFQYQQGCAAAGKHLCENLEWQTAAVGPPGWDGLGADDNCNTGAADPECGIDTQSGSWECGHGGQSGCVSTYGAYDMIGNASEFVARWDETGRLWIAFDGQPAVYSGAYGGDGVWNLAGRVAVFQAWENGWPAALLRGGTNWDHCHAGHLAASAHNSPAIVNDSHYGARCCSYR